MPNSSGATVGIDTCTAGFILHADRCQVAVLTPSRLGRLCPGNNPEPGETRDRQQGCYQHSKSSTAYSNFASPSFLIEFLVTSTGHTRLLYLPTRSLSNARRDPC